MEGFARVENAILSAEGKKGKSRIDVLKALLTMRDDSLAHLAESNDDAMLRRLLSCTCLSKLRRMAAVNSHGTTESTSFERFSTLLGVKSENSSKLGRGIRRRR